MTLVGQYLYNGPGTGEPRSYPEVLASAPLVEGLTYLLGRHYLMLAPSYEMHPLATLQGLVIVNLEDESCLIRPTLSIDIHPRRAYRQVRANRPNLKNMPMPGATRLATTLNCDC